MSRGEDRVRVAPTCTCRTGSLEANALLATACTVASSHRALCADASVRDTCADLNRCRDSMLPNKVVRWCSSSHPYQQI